MSCGIMPAWPKQVVRLVPSFDCGSVVIRCAGPSLQSAPVATVGNGIAVRIAARQFETSSGEPPNGAASRPSGDGSFTGIVNADIGSVVPR